MDGEMTPTSLSRTAKAMDRAIDLAIDGNSPYPSHAAFVDADSAHAGREITRAFDEGWAVVLVSADGREHVITGRRLVQGVDPDMLEARVDEVRSESREKSGGG